MSRFILGNCIDVMERIPDNAIDFILTDPPYLVDFRDRSGRTIAGDKTDKWLQPACNEMYRVLKKDALMVSFYVAPQLRIAHPVKLGQSCIPTVVVQP